MYFRIRIWVVDSPIYIRTDVCGFFIAHPTQEVIKFMFLCCHSSNLRLWRPIIKWEEGEVEEATSHLFSQSFYLLMSQHQMNFPQISRPHCQSVKGNSFLIVFPVCSSKVCYGKWQMGGNAFERQPEQETGPNCQNKNACSSSKISKWK